VWIIYLAVDKDILAWLAFVVLLLVAALGLTMFFIWTGQRRGAAATAGASAPAESGVPAEQHFPVSIVGLHGLLAVTTVVLVFLTAIGVGGS
jgi:hypothetical protein